MAVLVRDSRGDLSVPPSVRLSAPLCACNIAWPDTACRASSVGSPLCVPLREQRGDNLSCLSLSLDRVRHQIIRLVLAVLQHLFGPAVGGVSERERERESR